jgi:hypothetical protein
MQNEQRTLAERMRRRVGYQQEGRRTGYAADVRPCRFTEPGLLDEIGYQRARLSLNQCRSMSAIATRVFLAVCGEIAYETLWRCSRNELQYAGGWEVSLTMRSTPALVGLFHV